MTGNRIHITTRPITAANPLWGATDPSIPFEMDYEEEGGLRYNDGMSIRVDQEVLPSTFGAADEADPFEGTFNSLQTLTESINAKMVSLTAYITDDGTLRITSTTVVSVQLSNLDPQFDFIGALGLQSHYEYIPIEHPE